MNKHSGYTWIQTCATVVCNSKNAEEQNIICVNYVVSGKENCNLVFDCCQYEPVKQEDKESALAKENGAKGADAAAGADSNNVANNNKVGNKATNAAKDNAQETSRSRLKSSDSKAALVAAVEEDAAIEEPPPKPPSTRGRKRKNKNQETKDVAAGEQLNSIPTPEPAKISRVCHEDKSDGSTVSIPIVIPLSLELHSFWSIETYPKSQVKNLENAMSKHLNTQQNTTTDFSTDALLNKQQEVVKPISPVHWSGHNSHFYQPTPVPATALLQQLYANRESVIRATTRPSPNGTIYPGESKV